MQFGVGWLDLGSVRGGARLVACAWLMAICLLSPVAAQAADSARDYGCLRPLRVAVFEFGAWFHGGAGITPDFLELLAAKSGCQFELVDIPREEAWDALERGDVDIVPSSIRTPERDKLARFVNYLRVSNLMIAGHTAPKSLDAFIGETKGRLAMVDGFYYGAYFDLRMGSLLADARIVKVESPRQVFDLLRRGEVEAVFAATTSYHYYLSDAERLAHFKVIATGAEPPPSGLAFSRISVSAVQLDNWMRLVEQMIMDRTLATLFRRHLPPRVAQTILSN